MENRPIFKGKNIRGVDGSPERSIGLTFTHKGVPVVNSPGTSFEGQKARGDSVPPLCGCIKCHSPRIGSLTKNERFTYKGLPVSDTHSQGCTCGGEWPK
jgi:hypothetical protein